MSAEIMALLLGDFYMDGEMLVFTPQYHLRRGYCCNSNCRHCPYKEADDGGVKKQVDAAKEDR